MVVDAVVKPGNERKKEGEKQNKSCREEDEITRFTFTTAPVWHNINQQGVKLVR